MVVCLFVVFFLVSSIFSSFLFFNFIWKMKKKNVHLFDAIQLNRLNWNAFFVVYRCLLGFGFLRTQLCLCDVNSVLFTLLHTLSISLILLLTFALPPMRSLFLSFAPLPLLVHSQRQHFTHTMLLRFYTAFILCRCMQFHIFCCCLLSLWCGCFFFNSTHTDTCIAQHNYKHKQRKICVRKRVSTHSFWWARKTSRFAVVQMSLNNQNSE